MRYYKVLLNHYAPVGCQYEVHLTRSLIKHLMSKMETWDMAVLAIYVKQLNGPMAERLLQHFLSDTLNNYQPLCLEMSKIFSAEHKQEDLAHLQRFFDAEQRSSRWRKGDLKYAAVG